MSKLVCKCGKGYASTLDGLCCFCREDQHCPTRRDCKRFDIRRGEGLKALQYLKVTQKVNNETKSEDELLQECNALWSQIKMCSAPTSECVIVVNPEFLLGLKFHWRPANLYGFAIERDRYFLFGCEVLISQIQQSWRLLVNPDALIQRGVINEP